MNAIHEWPVPDLSDERNGPGLGELPRARTAGPMADERGPGTGSTAMTDASLGFRRRFARPRLTADPPEERPVRVHIPIAAGEATADFRLEQVVSAHPGVRGVTLAKAGGLLIVDYDPGTIGLADLARIVRLAGHPVEPGSA